MSKIDNARNNIEIIDQEMIELFKKRMNEVSKVFEYKKEHNLPIFNSARETELKEKNVQYLNDSKLEKYYLEFLDSILKISKEYQEDLYE